MPVTFWIIAFILTLYTYFIYIYKMVRKQVKPHIFTFIPAAIVAGIVTLAQVYNQAGWAISMSATTTLGCIIIVLLAPWYGETNITKFDTISLAFCCIAIICWLWTKNDLLAVILSCCINSLAFLPTWRKIYFQPHTESSFVYFLSALRALLSTFSVSNFTPINWLFPIYLVISNLGLGLFKIIRERKILKK